jgi:hypothetical protein
MKVKTETNLLHYVLQFDNFATQDLLVYYAVIIVTFTIDFLFNFSPHTSGFKTRHVMTAASLKW